MKEEDPKLMAGKDLTQSHFGRSEGAKLVGDRRSAWDPNPSTALVALAPWDHLHREIAKCWAWASYPKVRDLSLPLRTFAQFLE